MDSIWDDCKLKTNTLRQQYQMAMDLYAKKEAYSKIRSLLPSEQEFEKIINKELERIGYEQDGAATSDFVDGFIRGCEYMVFKSSRT